MSIGDQLRDLVGRLGLARLGHTSNAAGAGQRLGGGRLHAGRVSAAWSADLLALDDALTALAAREARQSQVVELRVFGGLTVSEISDELSVAPATIKHDWKTASAALAHELRRMDQWASGPPT